MIALCAYSNVKRIDSLHISASGDIRNLLRTVNGLPSDYAGKCDILFNDKNPIVVNRNWIILYTLLQPMVAIKDATELATHLMYSAALSPAATAHLNRCVSILYGQGIIQDDKLVASGSLPMRGKGVLHVMADKDDMKEFLKMPLSTYNFEEAVKNRHLTMLHPSRVDYRDRYLASLTPGHRMAWTRHQQTGVLAPFSASINHLTEPNR